MDRLVELDVFQGYVSLLKIIEIKSTAYRYSAQTDIKKIDDKTAYKGARYEHRRIHAVLGVTVCFFYPVYTACPKKTGTSINSYVCITNS